MTNNSDIVRDILFNAYNEIAKRKLISSQEKSDLADMIENFVDYVIEERPATKDEMFDSDNLIYIGYKIPVLAESERKE
jgi:hypothetical protein